MSFQAYLVRRLALGLVTIWLVTVIVFFGLRVVMPLFYGDVVDVLTAESSFPDAERERNLRKLYGLDQPVITQYGKWVAGMVRGDLGHSLFSGRSVWTDIQHRLPVSLELGLIGLFSSVFVAVPMGIMAALLQDRWPDYTLRIYAISLTSVPSFWIAIMIIAYGAIWFNWAPPIEFAFLHEDPVQHFKIMLLPGLLIGLTPSGALVRVVRSQMLEVLRQDYVRTARAKGLAPSAVVLRHALPNALIPVVTIIGLELPGLVAGTALFEIIFVLPGMGNYIVTSIGRLDYPVVQGINVMFAAVIVATVLVVDLSYGLIDPRIRYG